jgi:hypothetical protein
MLDQEIYKDYANYCTVVNHKPPTFEKWMSIRDTVVEYDRTDRVVKPQLELTLDEEEDGVFSPYERWEEF